MFDKDRNFGDLRLGGKATVFDKDKDIMLNKRKG